MPTKVLREPAHVEALSRLLSGRKLPITVTFTQGATRTSLQNRLAQRWFSDIARQLGDETHEGVRADCKMQFGVPILRAQNEAFRVNWDAAFAPLSHEARRSAVMVLDVPVTRLMTVRQMTEFMDEMQRFWTVQGIRLTDPEAVKYEEEFS
jgi:hypothetical protein